MPVKTDLKSLSEVQEFKVFFALDLGLAHRIIQVQYLSNIKTSIRPTGEPSLDSRAAALSVPAATEETFGCVTECWSR